MDQGRLRPFIAPVFLPNQGCPHRCVFCEQEAVTSQPARPIRGRDVKKLLETAVGSRKFSSSGHREVAFYGGTFTRLPLKTIEELLSAVQPYTARHGFHAIRVSTRPDALSADCLDLMKHMGVHTVELGVQSMDDEILSLTRRGHTREDTVRAVRMLKERGFRVGVQLMPGLPGDSAESNRETIREVIRLRPSMVRLYPAVVIRGTELAGWFETGRYSPLDLATAVDRCAEACMSLEDHGIPVIRIGLMSSPSLLKRGVVLAGPWHPALGFLVRSRIYHLKIARSLPSPGSSSRISVRLPQRDVPLFRGHRNRALRALEQKIGAKIEAVRPDDSLLPGTIEVEAA